MLKISNIIFFAFMLLVANIELHCQKWVYPSLLEGEELGVKQGLSQGLVTSIYQDKEGYMWFATKDGLNRYDGYTILTFRHQQNDDYSLPDNYCNAIVEDDAGNFWVGTNTKGLFLFDRQNEKFHPVRAVNNDKNNLCIRDIYFHNEKIFIETWTNALILDISAINSNRKTDLSKAKIIFDYNKFQTNDKYKLDENIYANITWNWLLNGDLWVNYPDSLCYFSSSSYLSNWTKSAFSKSSLGLLKGNGIINVHSIPDDSSQVLFLYNNTISHFNIKAKKIVFTKSLMDPRLTTHQGYNNKDTRSLVFIKPDQGFLYNTKTKEIEKINPSFRRWKGVAMISSFIDKNGIEWFGSAGVGIYKRDPRKNLFKSYVGERFHNLYYKLPKEYVPSIAHEIWKNYSLHPIVIDKQKTYWAFLRNKALSLDCQLISHNTTSGKVTYHKGLINNQFLQIKLYNDAIDNLWVYYQDISKNNFLAKVNKQTGQASDTYAIPNDVDSPEPFVSELHVDKKGWIWLATINGLYAFDEKMKTWKQWKNIPKDPTSLSSDGLLSICPDPSLDSRYLWLGTEGAGLNRFDKVTGKCERFDEKDGLPNNVAYCILSDSLNNLWISTNKGLSCFNPIKKTFRNFTDEDGLPGNEFDRNSAMRLLNGELLFGGVDGYVIFNPKEVLKNGREANIVFTSVSIMDKTDHDKSKYNVINLKQAYSKKLVLEPGQNVFTIHFATLEYRSNAKKMYKYKLDGFDERWSTPSNKNEVTFTNLSPGSYKLHVMGTNTDGLWNEHPIVMHIIVKPYWYQTWWFKSLILLLLLGVIYAFSRYRLMQGLRIEKLRNRIARDLHDEIGSTLSSIALYAESAKLVSKGNEKVEIILGKIDSNTTEMMEAMSDIVWAVKTENNNFYDLINRLRSFAVYTTESKNIELIFTKNDEISDVLLNMEQRKNIYLISKEAINNAAKYAEASVLKVTITNNAKELLMMIEDDGNGFDVNNKNSLNPSPSFGGNGLKNMKSRADEIGGELTIDSKLKIGTTILLKIPLKKSL